MLPFDDGLPINLVATRNWAQPVERYPRSRLPLVDAILVNKMSGVFTLLGELEGADVFRRIYLEGKSRMKFDVVLLRHLTTSTLLQKLHDPRMIAGLLLLNGETAFHGYDEKGHQTDDNSLKTALGEWLTTKRQRDVAKQTPENLRGLGANVEQSTLESVCESVPKHSSA